MLKQGFAVLLVILFNVGLDNTWITTVNVFETQNNMIKIWAQTIIIELDMVSGG